MLAIENTEIFKREQLKRYCRRVLKRTQVVEKICGGERILYNQSLKYNELLLLLCHLLTITISITEVYDSLLHEALLTYTGQYSSKFMGSYNFVTRVYVRRKSKRKPWARLLQMRTT